MQMHKPGSLTLAALLAVSLAGCGGGEAPLSKAEFVQQGNQICEKTEQRLSQAAARSFDTQGEIPSADKIESFVNDTVSPALEDELNGLRDLTPPEDDRERVDDILTAGQRALEDIRRDPTSLIGQTNPLENYHELASGYGLDKCGAFAEEVDRALRGLGPGGPVRSGETGGGGETTPTEDAGTVEPADPGAAETPDPVDPNETPTDTTG